MKVYYLYLMSRLKVIHIHPGAGQEKSAHIVAALSGMAEAGDLSRALCLFPGSIYMKNWQRNVLHPLMMELGVDCYIPPHAFTLMQFAINTAQRHGARIIENELRPALVSSLASMGPGLSKLSSDLIGELKERFPGMGQEKIIPLMTEAFEEADMPQEVATHAMKAMEAFSAYSDAMRQAGYADQEDALTISTGSLSPASLPYDCLILDGFYELTVAESTLIKTLISLVPDTQAFVPIGDSDKLEYCYTSELCSEFKIKPLDLKKGQAEPPLPMLYPAPSREEEVEAMARHIKQRHLSGYMRSLEDVLVVFPDMPVYSGTLRRVFTRYGVPLNLQSPQSGTGIKGAFEDLLYMLDAVEDRYPRLEFARFLMSPYFGNLPTALREKVPEAALGSGMLKGKGAWTAALGEETSKRVFKALRPIEELAPSATYVQFAKALNRTLKALQFYQEKNGLVEAAKMLERLTHFDAIAGKKVPLKDLIDSLRRLVEKLPTPEGETGVVATSVFEVRGMEPRVLYMGGLKDGDIPSRPEIDLLLPDIVRKRLGLIDMDRHTHLQEKIFRRLRRSAGELFLSYPMMEDDKVYLPSVFLSDIDPSPYNVPGHYCQEERMTAQGRDTLSKEMDEIKLKGAYGKDRVLKVTEIDAYRRCPRRFAIERLLGMSPSEITEYEIEPTTLGTIIHKVMEYLITGHPGSLDEFTKSAENALKRVLGSSEADEFFQSLIRESFMSMVPDIHEMEMGLLEEGFKPTEKEEPVEGEPLPGIRLKGKADRIDHATDGRVEIIDYKTGSATISGPGVESRGEDLQLFLYAAMLRDAGRKPERVGIYSLKDMKLKWVPGPRDLRKDKDMGHFIEAALGYLKDTARDMRAGEFPARPITDNACNTCHEVPFCPYMQGVRDA